MPSPDTSAQNAPVASQEAEARESVVRAGWSFGGPNRGPNGRDARTAINDALNAYAAAIRASERASMSPAHAVGLCAMCDNARVAEIEHEPYVPEMDRAKVEALVEAAEIARDYLDRVGGACQGEGCYLLWHPLHAALDRSARREGVVNYDEARQIATGPDSLGGWHWTTMNDGVVKPAAPCRRYTGPVRTVADMMRSPVKGTDFTTCDPHATKEEAERHFYDYSLEQVEERGCSWTSCAAHCGNPANKTLGNLGMALYFQPTPLCDEHRSRDELAALYPFATGIALMHS